MPREEKSLKNLYGRVVRLEKRTKVLETMVDDLNEGAVVRSLKSKVPEQWVICCMPIDDEDDDSEYFIGVPLYLCDLDEEAEYSSQGLKTDEYSQEWTPHIGACAKWNSANEAKKLLDTLATDRPFKTHGEIHIRRIE